MIVCAEQGDCFGTAERDTITPTDKSADNNGTDRVFARKSEDFVKPSSGRDTVFGEGDSDDLYGGRQKDKLFGLAGDDYIVGGDGEDQLNGAAGDDVIVSGDDGVADEVNCGPGEDIFYPSGPDKSSLAQECENKDVFNAGFEEVAEENPDVVGDAGDPADPAPESGNPADTN